VIASSLRILFVVVLTLCLVVQLGLEIGGITFHNPDISGVEPYVIFVIERFIAGHPLYENPEQPPFGVTQYSPLYYLLSAWIARALQIDPSRDVWSIYAVGRSISFVASLLTAVALYVASRRFLHLGAVVAFALAALSLIIPSINSIATRPDSLVRLLTVTAFFFYLIADGSEQRRQRYVFFGASIALLVVAVWTKQTAGQWFLIFMILSLLRKRWSDLAYMAGLSVVGSIAIYILVMESVGGLWVLYQNAVRGAFACGIDIEWAATHLATFPFTYGALISAFVVTMFVYFADPTRSSPDVGALLLTGAVQLALFTVAAMRYGIGTNHAYEAITFMTLAVATFWWRHSEAPSRSIVSVGAAATVAVYVLVFSLAQTANTLYQNRSIVWHPERDRLQVGTQERVIQTLRAGLDRYPGRRVFAHWVPYVNVRLFEHVVVPQVAIVGCTFPRRVFGYERFVDDVRSRQIKFIVTTSDQKLRSYAGADLSAFEPFRQVGNYVILMQPD